MLLLFYEKVISKIVNFYRKDDERVSKYNIKRHRSLL